MLDPDPESSPAVRISTLGVSTIYMMGDEKQFTSGVPSPLKSLVLVSCKEKTCAGLLDGETNTFDVPFI